MEIIISSTSALAIYEQIVLQMKNAIVSGKLAPDEAIPSIRTLASQLEVSVITTKRAYEELEKEKLIRSVPGKGFYVCDANKDYLKEKQYVILEKNMTELIKGCRDTGMTKEEFMMMADELWSDR